MDGPVSLRASPPSSHVSKIKTTEEKAAAADDDDVVRFSRAFWS